MLLQDHLPGPALPATPHRASNLTEEAARELFRRYVYAENNGEPFCPHCKSTALYTYKSRPVYKCKRCERQFRFTAGTPFEFKKLPFKSIIYIMARFCHAPEGISAREIADDLGVEYRTAFTWCHRFRAMLTDRMESYDFRGDTPVESDLVFFGGFIRPKNVAKMRTDRRKVPQKNEKRRGVVSLVERGGRIKTVIAFSETHATDWLRANTQLDQPIFLDANPGWSGFVQSRNNVKQVNHDEAYATPEANTNLAESFHGALRRAEDVYHHISHNYLDFYAAEAAWRQERPKRTRDGRMHDLLSLAARRGSSPIRGYYQHRRRRLPMVWSEHNEDAGKVRAATALRNPKANANTEAYSMVTASDVIARPELVPDQPGVYAVLLDGGERLLRDLGLPVPPSGKVGWREMGCDHVYTGEAGGIRTRLLEHLCGDVGRSNLRQSLLALQWSKSGGERSETLSAMDAELGRLLHDRALIAFKQCPLPGEVEAHLLAHHASPLNVKRPDAATSASVRHLRTVRKAFRREFASEWPPHTPRPRRR